MSYIEPNTNITLYRNTGLSPSYENTLYFANESDKDIYWASASEYIAGTFNKCYYQRSEKNRFRVEAPIRQLYKCDYLRFKNVSYEDHFYYGFVTGINYISNNVTEIEYVLDPIMTWMGTFNLKQCLVLRQHSRTDKIGDSLTDEGVQLGDYIITNVMSMPRGVDYKDYKIALWVATEDTAGRMSGGIYSASQLHLFDSADEVNDYIDSLVDENQAENITSILMIPAYIATASSNGVYESTQAFSKGNTNFDGYVPRNNKLFTYPYHKIVVANNAGAEQTYRAEFFTLTDENLKFKVVACFNNNLQIGLIPQNYKGTGNNYEEMLTMTDFPMCSYNYDSYKAWLAQYNAYYPQSVDMLEMQLQSRSATTNANAGVQLIGDMIGGALNGFANLFNRGQKSISSAPLGTGGLEGALLSGGASAISGLTNIGKNAVSNLIDRETKARESMIYNSVVPNTPQVVKGKVTPSVLFTEGALMGFRIYDKKITSQYARIIDDYFTMYGYTLNQVTTPNMNNRKYYTYVKTSGCNAGGEIPADDAHQIEMIFDNGVRFWKGLKDMGNYNLVNTPIDEM